MLYPLLYALSRVLPTPMRATPTHTPGPHHPEKPGEETRGGRAFNPPPSREGPVPGVRCCHCTHRS